MVELQPLAATVSLALTLRGVARQAQGEWEAAVADFDRSHATVSDFPAKNRFFRRHLLHRLGLTDRGPSLATIEARVRTLAAELGSTVSGSITRLMMQRESDSTLCGRYGGTNATAPTARALHP